MLKIYSNLVLTKIKRMNFRYELFKNKLSESATRHLANGTQPRGNVPAQNRRNLFSKNRNAKN